MYLVPEGREEIGIRWGRGKKCSGPYAWTPMHITVTESIPMHAATSSGNILKCTCQKTNEERGHTIKSAETGEQHLFRFKSV